MNCGYYLFSFGKHDIILIAKLYNIQLFAPCPQTTQYMSTCSGVVFLPIGLTGVRGKIHFGGFTNDAISFQCLFFIIKWLYHCTAYAWVMLYYKAYLQGYSHSADKDFTIVQIKLPACIAMS